MGTLEEQGFEIVPDVLDGDTVSSLIADVETSAAYRSRAGMRHALEIDAVRLLATDSRLISLAQYALGDSAVPFWATLFEKSPRSNWLVVWHLLFMVKWRSLFQIVVSNPYRLPHGVSSMSSGRHFFMSCVSATHSVDGV